MLTKFLSLTREKNFFHIEKEKDYYYQVSFKNSEFAFTRTESQAQSLVSQVREMVEWKKYKNITDLYETDPKEYDKVRKVIGKYAVGVRKNGNYRNQWKETGVLSYRLDFKGEVKGKEELAPGVALRQVGNNYAVDLILAGKTFKEFDKEEQAKAFVKKTQSWMPWHEENIIKIIEEDKEVSNFLKKLEWEIENGEPLSKPSATVISNFLFRNFGENSEEKKAVYLETIQRLGDMVGLKPIKDYVQNLFKMISAEEKLRALGIGDAVPEMHGLFVGPPGTGKTEVARMYGDLLWSLNKIPERKLIEVSKEDLVSGYIGETEKKTAQVIEKAMGGVLLVDEAYTLVNEGSKKGNDYGIIALEIIMRAMENSRGELVVIFAGYENDIEKLLDANDGLRSRFSKKFHFEDYLPGELKLIAEMMIQKQGFNTDKVQAELTQVIEQRFKKGEMSGNARAVRKLVGEISDKHKLRMVDEQGDFFNIHPDTVLDVNRSATTRTAESLKDMQEKANAKLEKLIGLETLKKEIKTWSNLIRAEKARAAMNMATEKVSLHMAFKGAPGTGKTTVARIVGEILKSNGLLSRGHFKEVSKSDLVAGYQGHTSEKVKKLMREMEGGVLFIDEAYSLVQGEHDQFGKEAVDTLIAEMENRREDLVIIYAGYPKEIDDLFDENPGFKSRVPNHFFFPDYNAAELKELLAISLKKQGFVLESKAENVVMEYIEHQWKQGETAGDGGNGRWVRNLIEKMKKNQADRISVENDYSEEALTTLKQGDVPNFEEKVEVE